MGATVYNGLFALVHVPDKHECDRRQEAMISTRNNVNPHFSGYDGYIGERFDVGRPRSDFAPPRPTLA
eukprot:scaffold10187_cov195-Cylindrotheca_fusiformis.AAC.5